MKPLSAFGQCRLARTLLAVALLIGGLCNVGCFTPVTLGQVVDQYVQESPKQNAKVVEKAKDESYTTAELIDRGLPSPTREWTQSVLEQARESLTKVVDETPTKLPRRNGTRGKEVYAKLTTIDLALLKPAGSGEALMLRDIECAKAARPLQLASVIYTRAHRKSGTYDLEVADAVAMELRLTVAAFQSSAARLNDPELGKRWRGKREVLETRFKLGVTPVLLTVYLLDRHAMSVEARRRVAKGYVETVLFFSGELLPEHRADLDTLLAKAAAEDPDAEVRRLATLARTPITLAPESQLDKAATQRGLR
jgi:hypothetical protein